MRSTDLLAEMEAGLVFVAFGRVLKCDGRRSQRENANQIDRHGQYWLFIRNKNERDRSHQTSDRKGRQWFQRDQENVERTKQSGPNLRPFFVNAYETLVPYFIASKDESLFSISAFPPIGIWSFAIWDFRR